MDNSVTTKNTCVDIKVKINFIPEQSILTENKFIFSYTITITNNSDSVVQLLTRSWIITDANGDVTTVEGEGVIGMKPNIAPGASYTYTSGCLLKTPFGTMQGHYLMQKKIMNKKLMETKPMLQKTTESLKSAPAADIIKVDIPVFRLAIPNIIH
ncbi:MAG: Co2+/Mg2+ efflux protein ApaG [Alteromonadaceae bacterium]|nr:Co2+/Mg2+ efflux protein ApaG [Alteromonadaceae bacterium]